MYGHSGQNDRGSELTYSLSLPVITSISQLNPYNTNATIKARVAFKSAVRTYTNQKGEGRLFHVELVDSSGEIKCTLFNEVAEQFEHVLQVPTFLRF
jgi:replication factor A1